MWFLLGSILSHSQLKEVKRNTAIRLVRWAFTACSTEQAQCLLPSTVMMYKLWAFLEQQPVEIEELVDDAVLCWVGAKCTDKVVLYIHGAFNAKFGFLSTLINLHFKGGTFFFPVTLPHIGFWKHVQVQLSMKDCDVGFAMLQYSA